VRRHCHDKEEMPRLTEEVQEAEAPSPGEKAAKTRPKPNLEPKIRLL
jgi:hypothetical protein